MSLSVAKPVVTPAAPSTPRAPNAKQRRQLETSGFLRKGGDATLATKAFQRSWKLPETGLVDSRTAARLQQVETRITSHLKRHEFFASIGQRSAGVRVDEQRLAVLGYNVGKVDGVYDRDTAAAVQAFRRDQGELKDGAPYLDPKAHAQLAKEIALLAHGPEHTRQAPTTHQAKLDALMPGAAASGLAKGAQGSAVYNLQLHLLRAGYQTKHLNGVFDGRTEAALKSFQRHAGLAASGKLDPSTWQKLKGTILLTKNPTGPAQSVGERSAAVKRSEQMLKSLGYKLNANDGYFTAATRNAVRAFQKKHHLAVTGTVNGATDRALVRAVRSLVPHTGNAFIDSLAKGAIAAHKRYGVPASVTIAQAILESGWGKSGLSRKAHNLFGIKGHGPAGSIYLPTSEYYGGWVTVNAAFRRYHNAGESIVDHAKLLAQSGYYGKAMARRHDARAFAKALTGVYATDPHYGASLIQLMNRYNLYRFDRA